MADWLSEHPQSRRVPRLWVENLWLLESREPLIATRNIQLRQGLNVVWAREPESDDTPGFSSFGHGVGKTSFCLLLRHCLGDEAPSISALCDKASAGFPMGGVAAKVHLDETTWMVFRPYGRSGQSISGRGESLVELVSGSLPGDFGEYLNGLQEAFVGRLSSATLPGSSQLLEWRHLLAWCIRDQKTRFDAFFHWRDGDGLGFRRPRQDPPLFVRSVLGLQDPELDRLMREVDALQSELSKLDTELPELERLPLYELTLAERRLRARVGALDDVPVFKGTVKEGSIEEMVETRLLAASAEHSRVELELDRAEEALAPEIALHKELEGESGLRELELRIAQSLLDNNESEFRRLTSELAELDRLVGRCRHGDVEFGKCEHIVQRRTTTSLSWANRKQAAAADVAQCEREVMRLRRLDDAAKAEITTQKAEVTRLRSDLRRKQMRLATVQSDEESLRTQWHEYLSLRKRREAGTSSRELEDAKHRRARVADQLGHKQSELLGRRMQSSVRGETVSRLTRTVANRILGEEGFGAFRPDSDSQPFELCMGGEAYQVLEVLLGDITTLLDSATSQSSLHPGLVAHDCPREADMSEKLYREFLLLVMEAEEQLRREDRVPFQYVVTTTSPPPIVLCGEPYLILELRPGVEEGLLFKRRLVPGLPGL